MADGTDATDIAARAREIAATLPISRPWDIDTFTAEIALMTGRPIVVEELPDDLADEVSGLWRPGDTVDRIYVTPHGDSRYRDHVRCHELAHIILAHNGEDELDVDVAVYHSALHRLAPSLPDTFIKHLQPARVCFAARSAYHSPIEQMAEWLATQILARADAVRDDLTFSNVDRSERAVLHRFASALGWKR